MNRLQKVGSLGQYISISMKGSSVTYFIGSLGQYISISMKASSVTYFIGSLGQYISISMKGSSVTYFIEIWSHDRHLTSHTHLPYTRPWQ